MSSQQGTVPRPWAGTWLRPTKAEWEQRNRATSRPSPAGGRGGSERKHPESGLPATELGQRSCVLEQQRSSCLCELPAQCPLGPLRVLLSLVSLEEGLSGMVARSFRTVVEKRCFQVWCSSCFSQVMSAHCKKKNNLGKHSHI